ncbi:MAG TPA: L-threonylcarbamoyladenylate synthase [Gemmata sp.]|nr:L-threonylcarbamoyladenylate synthase [Gemmata sp.]
MKTEHLSVDPSSPDPLLIARAAECIRAGGLVAFPTETVYGLGANALDPVAVGRIFAAKGRPPSNPLIVHVAEAPQILNIAAVWPETASRLAEKFWPGPLTIVVQKKPTVPDLVTAGGPTVAIRCPAHPVARALIGAAGVPLAAPSANRSTELSPTRAEHVLKGLGGRIDMVLDGGPCRGGLESTVVDSTGPVVRVLRPGPITMPMLEQLIGKVEMTSREPAQPGEVARSPGQMARHYSPRTRLRLVEANDLLEDSIEARRAGLQVGSVSFIRPDAGLAEVVGEGGRHISLTADPEMAAALLYAALHRLDELGLDLLLVEIPPDTPEWSAIRDRLSRAASRN